MLGTVARAGEVLDLFSSEAPEWGATAVARRLDIAKSQAHELLVSLTGIGLLRRSEGGRYRLGWGAMALGNHLMRSEIGPLALRTMAELARSLSAEVSLDALERGRVVTLARRRSGSAAADRVDPRSPVATTSGRLLLAGLTDEEALAINRMAADGASVDARTDATLCAELAEIRDRGAAVQAPGESDGVAFAVAVPISDRTGASLALGVALGAGSPEPPAALLVTACQGAAQRITRLLNADAASPVPAVAV